ncbi:MAG: hypothetical protein F6K56_18945 [Moorea sp. SIO3G5]|nr:hypothetical protein [Moorena sp. SIO3G5]
MCSKLYTSLKPCVVNFCLLPLASCLARCAILEQQKLIDQLERGSSPAQGQTQTQQPNYLTTNNRADLIQKSEKPKPPKSIAPQVKRKPGGQPGHQGKTRKGMARVDRASQIVKSDHQCVLTVAAVEFLDAPVSVSRKLFAQLVERPVEIVEYQYHTCKCVHCHRLCH